MHANICIVYGLIINFILKILLCKCNNIFNKFYLYKQNILISKFAQFLKVLHLHNF